MNLQAKLPTVETIANAQQFRWTREDGKIGIQMNPIRPALAHEVMRHPWFNPVLEYILRRLGDTCAAVFDGKVERTALGVEEWTCFLTVLDVEREIGIASDVSRNGYRMIDYLDRFMDCMDRFGRAAGMQTDDDGAPVEFGAPFLCIKENGAISSGDTLPIEPLWHVRARDLAVLNDKVISQVATGYQLLPSWSMRITVRDVMRHR